MHAVHVNHLLTSSCAQL